jgi:hypothetical protein
MKNRVFTLVFAAVLTLFGAALVCAQDQSAAPAPAKAAPAKKHAMAGMSAVPPETISGTLSSVDASTKTVVVTAGGVPYNFTVTGATKITVGGSKAKLDALSGDTSKQASVTFLSEKKKGNIAKSIEVTE